MADPSNNLRSDVKWQNTELIQLYLQSIRGSIPLAKEQIEVMTNLIAHLRIPVRKILDIGCGDGILGATLLERFEDAECVLTDFAEEMIQTAKTRLEKMGNRCRILLSDYAEPTWVRDLPYDKFDVVVSGFSIHHQPDKRKQELYSEIFELLNPEGIFVNIEHVASNSEFARDLHIEHFVDSMFLDGKTVYKNMTKQEVLEDYRDRNDKEVNILAPVEEQCEWLRQIGFQDVDCFFKIYELAVFAGIKPQ